MVMDGATHTCFNFYSLYEALTVKINLETNTKACDFQSYIMPLIIDMASFKYGNTELEEQKEEEREPKEYKFDKKWEKIWKGFKEEACHSEEPYDQAHHLSHELFSYSFLPKEWQMRPTENNKHVITSECLF